MRENTRSIMFIYVYMLQPDCEILSFREMTMSACDLSPNQA